MKVSRFIVPAAIVAVLAAPVMAVAQSGGQKPQTPAGGQKPEAPPMPKPGPEYALLKMDVGTWDAAIEMAAEPGGKPSTTKGVEINTLGCGGRCLISDFKAELMGSPFHGHGTSTWDLLKKKYTVSWTDSMSGGLLTGESTYDAGAKKMTGTIEGPDMTGKVAKMRSVVEYQGEGKRVFTMFGAGPDGKEMQMMRVTYTRRK
jgi:hypothetical protein